MKRLDLITEFEEKYQGSNLQKIVNTNPTPIKYTIDGVDCYFHNADLFGLFELKIKKNGLTPDDFAIDYKNGFEAGLLYLREKEETSVKHFKSKDYREGTIVQLKYLLHERDFKHNIKGLLHHVFKTIPLVFTEKKIFDYGYWNAVVSSIDELCEIAGLKTDELRSQPLTNEEGTANNQHENIFCKSMPLNIPKEHFKRFTTSNSKLNGKPFLSENELKAFIDRAFLGKKGTKKIKFNMAPKGEKYKVQYVFREFFDTYGFEYSFYQKSAIELLTNNFIGWDYNNVKNNFQSKPKQTI